MFHYGKLWWIIYTKQFEIDAEIHLQNECSCNSEIIASEIQEFINYSKNSKKN